MAKLNNGGWGVANLLTFLIVFVIFILIVSFLIYDVDHEKDSNIQLMEEEFIIFH